MLDGPSKKSHGFTLLEVMVAMAILAVSLLALMDFSGSGFTRQIRKTRGFSRLTP